MGFYTSAEQFCTINDYICVSNIRAFTEEFLDCLFVHVQDQMSIKELQKTTQSQKHFSVVLCKCGNLKINSFFYHFHCH